MFSVPGHAVQILARERILFFFFSTRLPTRSNYLPPAKEIKGWGRWRSKRRSRLNEAAKRRREPNTRSRKERKRDIWRKDGLRPLYVCARENISPISGYRVSGYAQRVITLSWRTFLHLAYVHAVLLPSPPLRAAIRLFCWTVPTPSSSCSNGAPLRRALLLPGASPETKKYDSPREKMA